MLPSWFRGQKLSPPLLCQDSQSFVSSELCVNPNLGAGIPSGIPEPLIVSPEGRSHQEQRAALCRKAQESTGVHRELKDCEGFRACDEPKAEQKIACLSLFPHSCNPDEQINCRVT